jgi:hypothetical protein
MSVDQKHDLLMIVLSLFVLTPVATAPFLYNAYRVAAKAPQIPDDVLKAGPGLAGLSAIGGGVVGAGFTEIIASSAQGSFADGLAKMASGIILMLLGGSAIATGGILIMRGGFRATSQRQDRHRLGLAALGYESRRLSLQPYLTAIERVRYLELSDHAMALETNIRKDYRKIHSGWPGFAAFARMYISDKDYRKRNDIHTRVTAICFLAVAVVICATWWCANSSPALVIACLVTAEPLAWAALRWRYERIRLKHLAEAFSKTAAELRLLSKKKHDLLPGRPVHREQSDNLRFLASTTALTVVFSWIAHRASRRAARLRQL